jgi:hypothetical protein
MAEPSKGAQSEDVEHKVVGLAEAKAGVKLQADRRVVLTVNDLGVAPAAARAATGESSHPATSSEGSAAPEKAEAPEPNFHVQLELPDGSDYARKKACVLEIPGHPSLRGTTNDSGELVLSVPNVSVESALLRLFDGGAEIAAWPVTLREEEES